MEKLLTTKDLAKAIGASESSLRRWTDSGAIRTSRTVGGHRRIPLSEAIRFIRSTQATVVHPQILGLDDVTTAMTPASDAAGLETAGKALHAALLSGDTSRARGQMIALYLGGMSLAAIFDGPVGYAFGKIGELWQHDARGILVEHRATDICVQAVSQLRQLVEPSDAKAPAAVGGAPAGDPYLLPSMMAAAVLAEAGYREMSLGPQTPLDVLATAAREMKAKLVWLSVSVLDEDVKLRRATKDLAARLLEHGATLVIGGRHAQALVPRPIANVHVLRTMSELAAYAKGVRNESAVSRVP